MRVAFSRLLRRPSTTDILRHIVTAPRGLERWNGLVASRHCLRCYIHTEADSQSIASPDIKSSDFDNGDDSSQAATDAVKTVGANDIGRASRFSASSLLDDVLYEAGVVEPGRKSANLISNYLPPDPPMDVFGLDNKRLEFESNVTEPGARLIDTETFSTNFGLWKELLSYQRRMNGAQGVIRIFRGMRARNVDVPTDGQDAEYFWRHFIDAGLWGPDEFMEELVEYVRDLHTRTGQVWPAFYESAVGALLENNLPGMATRWHNQLRDIFLQNPNDIIKVFPQSLTTKNGLRTFRRLLDTVPGHKIHKQVVPLLWQQRRPMDAMTMHRYLTERDDCPESLEEIEALVRYAENYGFTTEKEVLLRSVAILTDSPYEATLRFVAEHGFRALSRQIKEEEISEETAEHAASEITEEATTGDTESGTVKEKKFSDDLGARLFATNAFTFDLILSGLKMFGVSAIGPASLREMAVRAATAEEIHDNIKALEKAGISIGTSVFSRIVKRLAAERSERMLRDVLHSDQHPDALEDQDLQERLLLSYTREQDWNQVHKTMAILSVITEGGKDNDPNMYNIRIRLALKSRDIKSSRMLLAEMREHGVVPDRQTISIPTRYLLHPRSHNQEPRADKESCAALLFVISFYQTACLMGGQVATRYWAEPLRRLGMIAKTWDEFRATTHWLARFYLPPRRKRTIYDLPLDPLTGERLIPSDEKIWASPIFQAVKEPPNTYYMIDTLPRDHKHSMYRQLFHPNLQRAIIAWGFLRRLSLKKPRTYALPLHYTTKESLSPKLTKQAEEAQRDPEDIPQQDYVASWCRGIVLLRELRDLGVPVQASTVQRAVRSRLAILYGDDQEWSYKRNLNKLLRTENPFTLEELLYDIEKCWPGLMESVAEEKRALVNPQRRPKSQKYQTEQEEYENKFFRERWYSVMEKNMLEDMAKENINKGVQGEGKWEVDEDGAMQGHDEIDYQAEIDAAKPDSGGEFKQ
ncbi:Pentatricopeptide repeat protein [Ascosphaera apis ARSEF 7405]|uniref:Pentatricopeptide repeat protein n=1 Tax=Ascosphaera apis ARSEF 7405 TaxID=392613 RepID=A0A162IMY9_9EURO|nr:Pentatricopeptide repeat protein [Ascosphaera apis ARSEF 7405]